MSQALRTALAGFVSALLLPALAARAQLAPPAPICPAPAIRAHKFAAGEKLRFRLDVFGADVGTLEVWLEPPPREERASVALVARARAKTSAFVSTNLGDYSALANARIASDRMALSSHEEVEDAGIRWVHDLTFPPRDGKLRVRASKNGEPVPLELLASSSARDLLSAFLEVRATPLVTGTPICTEVFAGRRMWKLSGSVGPRETIDSPLGKRETVRVDLTSVRLDDPRVVRTARFWITDDGKRLPIAAVAEVKGKVIRAQLESASGSGWKLSK